MTIENTRFRTTRTDEEGHADTITCRLNEEERKLLEYLKDLIHEDKDSSAIKDLALVVAANVLKDPGTQAVLELGTGNLKRGWRVGRLRKNDI